MVPWTITNSTIVGNAACNGAGIYSCVNVAIVTNSTIVANTATGSYGGIYHYAYGSGSALLVNNSVVALNVATEDNDN